MFLAVLALAGPVKSPLPGGSPAPSRTIVGEIVSIDVVARRIVVRESVKTTKEGQATRKDTVTMTLDPAAAVQRGKRKIVLGELKANDHVVARYLVTPGGARAISLRVADLPAAPAAPLPDAGPATSGN